MKRIIALLLMVLWITPAFAQRPEGDIKVWGQYVSNEQGYQILLTPPPGKTWKIVGLTFLSSDPLPGTTLDVVEKQPLGGSVSAYHYMIHVRLKASATQVPIIGGYINDSDIGYSYGNNEPLVVSYPNSIVLGLTNLPPGWVWTLTTGKVIETVTADAK